MTTDKEAHAQVVSAGNHAITEITEWLLAYHPQPVTRANCNWMRYFAQLAYTTIEDIEVAMKAGSAEGVASCHARFFARVKEVTGDGSPDKGLDS